MYYQNISRDREFECQDLCLLKHSCSWIKTPVLITSHLFLLTLSLGLCLKKIQLMIYLFWIPCIQLSCDGRNFWAVITVAHRSHVSQHLPWHLSVPGNPRGDVPWPRCPLAALPTPPCHHGWTAHQLLCLPNMPAGQRCAEVGLMLVQREHLPDCHNRKVSEELINNETWLWFSISASLAFKKLSVNPKFKKLDDSRRIISYCIKSN